MTKKFDSLNKTFNIDEETSGEIISVETSTIDKKIDDVQKVSDDIEKDFQYSRGNLYSLVEKGQEAINGILELAQESEMPRAYEVAAQLIKNTSEVAEKLMTLHKIKKDADENASSKGPTTVNNALFVGSTAELAKLLKQHTLNKPDS